MSQSTVKKIPNNYFDGMPVTGFHKIVFFIIMMAYFCEQMDNWNFGFIAPALMHTWGLQMSDIGVVTLWYFIGMTAGGFFGGVTWLRGGNGRIVDGGIWNQANMTLTDAGEPLLQFVDGAESIGFGWYPLGYQKADGSFNSGALGKWGYVWFIGQTNASTARSLVISGTSLNLQTKTNQEAAKDIYLNVRCVKNYTK